MDSGPEGHVVPDHIPRLRLQNVRILSETDRPRPRMSRVPPWVLLTAAILILFEWVFRVSGHRAQAVTRLAGGTA